MQKFVGRFISMAVASLAVLFGVSFAFAASNGAKYELSKSELDAASAEAANEDSIALKAGANLFFADYGRRGWCTDAAFWALQSAVEFDRQLHILDKLYCEVLAVRLNHSATTFYKPVHELKAQICAPMAMEQALDKIEADVAALGPQTEKSLRRAVEEGQFEFAMAKRRPQILAHRDFVCK